MEIPRFDMQVLCEISDSNMGLSLQELTEKFGFEVRETLDFLLKNATIKIHERDIKPFMSENSNYQDPPIGNFIATSLGKLEVKRWKTKQLLTTKERWKERIVAFISGAILATLPWLLSLLIR